jgi:sporulation protein YlmC with PRC-barrel domain
MLGCRLISEGGMYLGTVRDVDVDVEERRITDFRVNGRGLLGFLRGDVIPAAGHLRFGSRVVIVPNMVAVSRKALVAPPVEGTAAGTRGPEHLPRLADAAARNGAGEEGLVRAVGE